MKRFLLPLLLTWPGAALAAQPAPQPAPAQDLQLTFKGELKKIDDGQLVTAPVTKSWTLPAKWVARSREYNKLSSYLTPYLDRVEKETFVRGRPAKFEQVGNKWVATDQPEWKLDRPATEAKLLEAIRAGETTLPVVFSEKVPQRSVALLAERGVTRNLASARSSFTGSPDFRVKNIVVGSSKLDYQWVAPGEDFDFNKSMGDINAANGFVPGYIISGGTLALEDGGGICQVSTTIFRALWEAGLPIVERNQHSYRVHYYDPVGYEATVYAPSKNLRMKNDTDAYIFIQASWNTATQKLRFDVFGPDTGRKTQISTPVVTDVKPAAAPTFTPDKRVVLGQQRLLDQPMEGMTSVITRTVTFRDGTSQQDSIKSVYKPWGAVYGVHPSDPRLKQTEAQAKK
ncbi:VanW family protein [Deinococcus sp. PESE-13]